MLLGDGFACQSYKAVIAFGRQANEFRCFRHRRSFTPFFVIFTSFGEEFIYIYLFYNVIFILFYGVSASPFVGPNQSKTKPSNTVIDAYQSD